MKSIQNFITDNVNINESATDAKMTIWNVAKENGFDFKKTTEQINKNQQSYIRRSDRMSNAAGMKYLDTLRYLTTNEEEFNKFIDKKRKSEEKREKTAAKDKEARLKTRKEVLENFLKLGNEKLTVILKEKGNAKEFYQLSIDDDYNIVLEK